MRKTLIATSLIAMVALSACSRNSEDTAADTTTTEATSSTTAVDSSSETSAAEESAEASSELPTDIPTSINETELAASASAMQEQLQQQFDELKQQITPIQGSPASQEDINGIRATLNNIYGQASLKSMTQAMLDNSCSEIRAEMQAEIGDSLNQMPDVSLNGMTITLTDLKDATVNGDDASATAVLTSAGQTQEVPMQFKRENGSWKFCTQSVVQ